MMQVSEIKNAVEEARRFIERSKAAIKRIENDEMAQILGTKETAALRRASLDLTRALADMRKPS